MLAVIDESGDGGFEFDRSSSQFFTIAVVFFEFEDLARDCVHAIERCAKSIGMRPIDEFHCAKDAHDRRMEFIECVRDLPFAIAAASFAKQKCPPDSPYRSYPELVHYVAKAALALLEPPPGRLRTVCDASGDRRFLQSLAKRLKAGETIGNGVVLQRMKGSRSSSDRRIQLADCAAGVADRLALDKRGAADYLDAIGKERFRHRILGPDEV